MDKDKEEPEKKPIEGEKEDGPVDLLDKEETTEGETIAETTTLEKEDESIDSLDDEEETIEGEGETNETVTEEEVKQPLPTEEKIIIVSHRTIRRRRMGRSESSCYYDSCHEPDCPYACICPSTSCGSDITRGLSNVPMEGDGAVICCVLGISVVVIGTACCAVYECYKQDRDAEKRNEPKRQNEMS